MRVYGLAAAALALGTALVPAATSAQQQLPAVLAGGQPSTVPTAVQILRWHMLDGDVNSLTFRSMDTLFPTRSVPRAGPVWQLPRADKAMDFTYDFDGKTHAANDFLERTYTNALLVIKDGRIVTEIYRNNSHERTRFIGWSMTKSVTSVLVGCAVADGHIKSVDDPVVRYLPELKGSAYDGVSVRQVLQMRSGVDYEERYDFANPGVAATNHINALVKNVARFADMARTVKRAHNPGEVFAYKTIDTAVLGWLVERVTDRSVASYTASCLWEPLGAEADGFYMMDGPPGVGREFSGAGFNATLRDWGRFGQMMLNDGAADGRRVVSADWVRESTAPTAPATGDNRGRGGYGYQWWMIGGPGAYSALGLQGQYVFVDPASRTVVVKLSYFPPAEERASGETAAFLEAAAKWSPR